MVVNHAGARTRPTARRTARRSRVWCLMLGGRAPRPEREPYTREAMADKVDKPKKQKSKAKQDEKGVLAALPSSGRSGSAGVAASRRPGAEDDRDDGGVQGARRGDTTAKPAAKKRAAKPRAAAARKTAPAKPRATATRRKAAAAADVRADPGRGDGRRRGRRARRRRDPARARGRTDPRPRPVSEGAPGIGTAGYRDGRTAESGRPSGADARGDRRAGRRRGRPARPHDRLASAQARGQPAAAAVAGSPFRGCRAT